MFDATDTTRRYFTALNAGSSVLEFYAPDVVQEEFPNRLMPGGARRDLAGIAKAAESGRKVMSAQRFDVIRIVASGESVAVEFNWTGTLAVPLQSLKIGDQMKGRFAMFMEFRDGLIVSQRNYDCFEAW